MMINCIDNKWMIAAVLAIMWSTYTPLAAEIKGKNQYERSDNTIKGQDTSMKKSAQNLPDYVHIDVEACALKHVLRDPAETVLFPLSEGDQKIVDILREKFLKEENCAGLAAPQIGFSKRIIVYAIPEDIKNYRLDSDEVVPTRVLINPGYEPMSDTKVKDWEGCFSVAHTCGEVPRYKEIRYWGYDEKGRKIEGVARGFHARLLQHEIGHINGELFIDLFTPDCRSGPLEEMRALRKKEFEAAQKRR